ncbi:MAG: hypothetical protein ACRD2N_13045 [Vicinamibacterales bacterium]
MSRVWLGVFLACAVGSVAGQSAPPPPTLTVVLKRTATYVAEYQVKLAGIVAEEQYSQSVVRIFPRAGERVTAAPQHRELKSDLLLVRLEGEDRWVQFRDVFEVDRKPVRDRDERLFKLFIEPNSGSRLQAELISNEGSRYNIGPLLRTVNVPILALVFFETPNLPRFSHKRAEPGDLRDFAGQARESDIWAIDYRETAPRTVIRGESGRDLKSNGRLWVDSSSGRVLKTELRSGDAAVRAQITVTYKSEPGLDLLVPAEMKESYMLPRPIVSIQGRAVYSHFRQFKVVTTEKTKQ